MSNLILFVLYLQKTMRAIYDLFIKNDFVYEGKRPQGEDAYTRIYTKTHRLLGLKIYSRILDEKVEIKENKTNIGFKK